MIKSRCGIVAAVAFLFCCSQAEAEDQVLDQGQGVMWVEGGVDSEVPENAISVKIGRGLPLCRGTKGVGTRTAYKDIGTVSNKNGKCRTQRKDKYQESFYYLVPTHAGGEPPMDGSMLPDRTATLEAELLVNEERLRQLIMILEEVAIPVEVIQNRVKGYTLVRNSEPANETVEVGDLILQKLGIFQGE
jgi:hypothetical protein